jgi:hypothetical protein
VEENQEEKVLEQGILEVIFREEMETTKDLGKRLKDLREKRLPSL